MNHLRRTLAPIPSAAWKAIEAEARDALKTYLAARKLVDFDGPHGFGYSAVNLGRTTPCNLESSSDAEKRIDASLRQVAPLLELRVPFELPLRELDDVDRGATDLELAPVVDAARTFARAEDRAVFYGVDGAGMAGMVSGSTHEPVPAPDKPEDLAKSVSTAMARLRSAGVDGPYGLALDSDHYTAMLRATGPGGYPVLQHMRRLLDGPTVWAPALEGALLVSLRGGDFELVVGQDISVGYRDHTAETISLYLEETFTFRVKGPEAAVPLGL